MSLAKNPSTALSQEAEVGVKWKVQRGCRASHAAPWDVCGSRSYRRLRGSLFPRDLGLDRVEEADELLVTVALHAPADHLAFQHVEGGEQRSGAVTLIVMGHGAGAALLYRKARLGAVQRLDLALFIDGKNYGVGRRVE